MSIKIIGTGSYVPERILTNFDLEKIVDTSDEWIRTRTGMVERRIARDDETTSSMGVEAAKRALKMANVAPEDIDLIVVGTVTPDYRMPTNACLIQSKLKVGSAVCFDFQAACTGFIYGLEIVNALMKYNHSFKNVLLIGSEKLSSVTDWTDRNTCVLFGDAAGAVVFSKTLDPQDTVLSSILHADGTHGQILAIEGGGCKTPITAENVNENIHCITMEGNKVFRLAVNAMVSACKEALDLAHLSYNEISWLIPHQANMRIINAVGKRLDISNVFINIEKYGNTSVCTIMLALDELVRARKINKGDKILLTAFGGGMTWGAAVLKW